MENNEQNVKTPRGGKKKGATKALSFRKMLSRRVNRSISSERGGSASSFENVPTDAPASKRLGTLRRLSRNRNKNDMATRGAVTERVPRRSFSVDDVQNIDNEGAGREETDSSAAPTEKEVAKDHDFDDAEQFAKPIIYTSEGLVPPDTPVHGQHHNPRAVDTRSNSSANISGNDELQEAEAKEVSFDLASDNVHVAAMQARESDIEEKVKEIDALRDSSYEYAADAEADATIDAQIERTVIDLFTRNEASSTDVPSDEIAKDTEPAKEIETEKEKKENVEEETEKEKKVLADEEIEKEKTSMVEEETKIEKTQAESTELAEAVAVEKTEKDAEAFVESMDDIHVAQVTSKSRGIEDMTDLLTKAEEEDQAVADDGEEDKELAVVEPETSITKPKRRRKLRIIRRASISLASLAVGLLIVIIKNKH